MAELIDEFIEESKKMVGKEVAKPLPANTHVSKDHLDRYSDVLAMEYILNDDPAFVASSTRYGMLLAPQTYLASARHAANEGAYGIKDYNLAKFFTEAEFEWFDVIRIMDNIKTELKLVDVSETTGNFWEKPQRIALLSSKCIYWNQYNNLLGTCKGTMSMVPYKIGDDLFINRDIYEYSEDEIKEIRKGIESEFNRGEVSLYWEDVNIGDRLTPVVKGPIGLPDIFGWRKATNNLDYALELIYRRALKEPGYLRTNPTTNWPYYHKDLEIEDYYSCKGNGMPQPWLYGLHRICLAEDLITKWMSIESFIRRLKAKTLLPAIYGDTMWYKGEITKKYKETLSGVTYKAVDLNIEATNQLGEKILSGEATVYLASKGQPVTLPIPQ